MQTWVRIPTHTWDSISKSIHRADFSDPFRMYLIEPNPSEKYIASIEPANTKVIFRPQDTVRLYFYSWYCNEQRKAMQSYQTVFEPSYDSRTSDLNGIWVFKIKSRPRKFIGEKTYEDLLKQLDNVVKSPLSMLVDALSL